MNRKERFKIAGLALGEARELNRLQSPILVEGLRDKRALRSLGFTGPVEILNRGKPIEDVIVYLIESYLEEPILLMDWDRTGGRLQRNITNRLMALDRKVNVNLRIALSKALRPETLCVETMHSLAENLLPYIDIRDPEGAVEPFLP